MHIEKINRKGHLQLVKKMRVGDLDSTKCSRKFLSHHFDENMIVNVKCHEDGTFDLRGKVGEYRIVVPDKII